MTNLLHDISWVVPLRSDILTPIFRAFTAVGYPNLIMIGLALTYWLWSKPAASRLMLIVVLSTLLNAVLKDYWQNPRPDALFRLDAEVGASFGMPSGHAQVSAVLWFYLAYEIRRLWAWMLAGFMVAGICASRLYLGVHDLEDIVAGLSLALMSLILYVRILNSHTLRQLNVSIWFKVIALGVLGGILFIGWPSVQHSLGALVAVGLAISWMLGEHFSQALKPSDQLSFESNPLKRFLAVTVGLVVLFALLAVAKFSGSDLPSLASGMLITVVLGFHVTLVAPYLFRLLKLS